MLEDIFVAIATDHGLNKDVANELVTLLPEAICSAPCSFDRLTGIWRYSFGNPFQLPDGAMAVGTHMYPSVEMLFNVLLCASRRLPSEKLNNYLRRLADPSKHEDLLIEFAPILRLDLEVTATYEVEGYGEMGNKVDWLLSSPHSESILLEVKNRSRDLLESLIQIHNWEIIKKNEEPAPAHDTSLLFRSLEAKFRPNDPRNITQGAWIKTSIKQEASELHDSFAQLDTLRVHFVILGDWDDDVYFLCNAPWIKKKVLAMLKVRESRRFVFTRR